MKPRTFIAVTADQIGSRRHGDRVPEAIAALSRAFADRSSDREGDRTEPVREFQRTAGDEIQGLLASGTATVAVVRELTRLGAWRIGIGIGAIDEPIPDDVRDASGACLINARGAVERARTSPVDLAVRGSDDSPEPVALATSDAEAALWLLVSLWRRRTPAGWEVAEALATGRTGDQVAADLGITPSAVSQRAATAGWREERRGTDLATRLIDRALDTTAT